MKKLIFFVSLNFLIINCISIQFIYPQATPILLQGFPVLLDSIEETYNTGPIVEDFNNDGEKEILVGVNLFSAIGKVCLIDNKGNSFPNFPKLVSCVASYIWVVAV